MLPKIIIIMSLRRNCILKNTMKKLLFLFLLIALLFAVATTANAETTADGLEYFVNDNEVTISDYTGNATDLNIPAEIDGLPVTSIGEYAFGDCVSLTDITIPDSVTSISDYAFFYCYSLTDITIPNSVRSIGEYAFCCCRSLTSITIPDSVTSIGERAFYRCESLISITILDGVTSIGEYAFGDCVSLTGITIPDSVTSISVLAFYRCLSLTSITIPDSVISIGDGAFLACESLVSITIPDSVTSIGYAVFAYCDSLVSITVDENNAYYSSDEYGVLFNKDNTTLIQYPAGKEKTSYTIPDSVTSIGEYAFAGCHRLTSITISDSVTSIGKNAFRDCESLTSITIPDSVTSIDHNAFADCVSLVSITILNPDCEIYDDEDTISDTATIYGHVGSTAQSYAKEYDRTFLETSMVAFGTCGDSLTWMLDTDGILTIAGTGEMDDYEYAESPWHVYKNEIITVMIENGVTSIGEYAFAEFYSLTSITIPDSVTSIGFAAIGACESLISITIPDSVTCIGDGAFVLCESLISITIPDSVTSIGYSAFGSCYSLTNITIPDSVTSIGELAFIECNNLASITVDENNAYYCSDEYGVLFNKDKTTLIQYPAGKEKTSYTIPDSVTSIGYAAFAYCGSLVSITIPDSVTSIGDAAFGVCESLINITIPDNVTSIGEYAFGDCYNLTSITILNPTCEIYDAEDTISDTATIYGHVGSTAQSYAERYGRTFVPLVPPHSHSFTASVTTPATHTATGVMTYTCSCGDSYTEVIEKTADHSYTASVTTPATHTATGLMTYTCSCGDTYTEVIAKTTKHTYTSAVLEEPDCLNAGKKLYTCECGDSYIETLPALGHVDKDGNASCDRCGTTVCDHLCHKDGILGFFWKIIRIFQKLFGMNPVCECGAAHY